MLRTGYRIVPGRRFDLKKVDPGNTRPFKSKAAGRKQFEANLGKIAALQNVFFAVKSYAALVILHGMDGSGKDGVIKSVFAPVHALICETNNFRVPSEDELLHDYMWRCVKRLPQRGKIGIFNRSYYEEVAVVRVHPEYLRRQHLPPTCIEGDIWKRRFRQINDFEHYLTENGILVLKFFLHISKHEQRSRLLERIERPDKRWKASLGDAKERLRWNEYLRVHNDMLQHTSTPWAPWNVIPADHKWFAHALIAEKLCERLEGLHLEYPPVTPEQEEEFNEAVRLLKHSD